MVTLGIKTGRKIRGVKMPKSDIRNIVLNAFQVFRHQGVAAAVLLSSMLPIARHVFQKAGYPIQFLIYIYGTSGSLKTASTLAFFDMFEDENAKNVTSFQSTVTSLEVSLTANRDRATIVDDLPPAPSARQLPILPEKLETLV